MTGKIRVAVCGDLPTACDHLLKNGVVKIDQYMDATEIGDESAYHLILIYAPQAEGLLNTQYTRGDFFEEGFRCIPIRLLNEPCCSSALIELESTVRRIAKRLKQVQSSSIIYEKITPNDHRGKNE